MRNAARKLLYLLLLVALLAVPRLVGIDRFATIDEPYWLTAGSDFYYALGQRAFANTVYDYHPAVTTMWVIAAGMLVYFPQYRGLGQGYFDVYKDSLEEFLLAHGHTPLGLMTTARVIQTVVIVMLLVAVFWLLRRLLGNAIAWTGTLLISFDPFFLGHSRLLNHEGMLSLFVMISLLALLVHQLSDRRFMLVLVSGAAAGFAQLTKSSSIVLLPVAGALFVLDAFLRRELPWKRRLPVIVGEAAAWAGMLVAVYFAFWPGMWVAPGEMLYQVFGNALSYAFEGSRLTVTGGVQPSQFNFRLADIVSLIPSVLWRTTLITWLGFVLGVIAAIRQSWKVRIVLGCVFLIGFAFIVLFGVASGRNSAHYMMTAYISANIIAAVGYVHAATWLASRARAERLKQGAVPVIAAAAVVLQLVSAVPFFPYYYTYHNPVMEALKPGRQNPAFGYGEGLELAAEYLAQKPDALNSTVIAFYGRGAFSFFYPGKTEQLKTAYADPANVAEFVKLVEHSSYIVLYYQLEHDRNSPANVMQALAGVQPEKSIWMNGIEYIRIYKVGALPPQFYTVLTQ